MLAGLNLGKMNIICKQRTIEVAIGITAGTMAENRPDPGTGRSGGGGHDKRGSARTSTSMQTPLGDYQQTMQKYGYEGTHQQEKLKLGKVVRGKVFKKLKFAQPEIMGVDGKVAKSIKGEMGYNEGDGDNQNFALSWETWIKKEVRTLLNEKRSACAQAIMRAVLKSK